jgi:hypothetical protein
MLQDLDQHRKGAIRNFVQFAAPAHEGERRLTRGQFTVVLQEQGRGEDLTVFAVSGLNRLQEVFRGLDKSVNIAQNGGVLDIESVRISTRFGHQK